MSAHADDCPPPPSMAELREQMAKTQAEFEERLEKRPCGCYRWDEDCPYYEKEKQ